MQFDIQENRIVIKKGRLGSAIWLLLLGAIWGFYFYRTFDGSSTIDLIICLIGWGVSLGFIVTGIITFVKAYRQIIIDKDGIRGLSKGDLKWEEIRKVKMEQQRVYSWSRSTFFQHKFPNWGLSISSNKNDTFIAFDDDRPQMDLVQAINAIAPFKVMIDQDALAEYREATKIFEENRRAKNLPAPEEEKKPVDNSLSITMIVGIVVLLLLIGLMIWRLTQI